MFGLGMGELLVILIIVLIVFGAGKLPEIGHSLGKGVREFKKAFQEEDEKKQNEVDKSDKPE